MRRRDRLCLADCATTTTPFRFRFSLLCENLVEIFVDVFLDRRFHHLEQEAQLHLHLDMPGCNRQLAVDPRALEHQRVAIPLIVEAEFLLQPLGHFLGGHPCLVVRHRVRTADLDIGHSLSCVAGALRLSIDQARRQRQPDQQRTRDDSFAGHRKPVLECQRGKNERHSDQQCIQCDRRLQIRAVLERNDDED